MAYRYDLSQKKYTDVPMLDEIMHNVKLILQDIVIKDKEEADRNETSESINDGELYVSCVDGTANIHSFTFNRARLETINEAMKNDADCGLTPWTVTQIDSFVKSKDVIPEEYYDYMVKIATQDFIDNYVEKNNYYRMLAGEPNYGTPDLYIDIDYIPKKFYKSFIQPEIDNRGFIPNDEVKYFYGENNAWVQATTNEGKYQKDPLDEYNYVYDSKIKYIWDSESFSYKVYTTQRYSYNEETGLYYKDENGRYEKISKPGFVDEYIEGPQLYIRNSDYIDGTKTPNYFKILAQRYLYRVSITQLSSVQLALLQNEGIIAKIAEDNPERRYLNYIGSKSVDYYTARKAKIFEVLFVPEVEELVKNRFLSVYDKERVIYLKRYYSLAYKNLNPLYDKFFIMLLVGQVVTDIIAEVPEWYIRRDVFDLRTCQYILEANGVKFFRIIPLKYQIAIVRKLNQLIKYKSTTKSFYDLAKIFGLEDVTIYKHYLVKTNNTGISLELADSTQDLDGGREQEGIIIDYINMLDGAYPDSEESEYTLDKDGGKALWDTNFMDVENLLSRFTLFFLKVPIGGSLDNYIHDEYYRIPYDTVTTYDSDPYWDGENDHDTVKYWILQKEFSTQSTKYLSLNSNYDMSEYQFQMTYFMNLIMNNKVNSQLLNLSVPSIDPNSNITLRDLIIYLYCFATKYFPCQLTQGIQNKVFVNNRDPKTDYVNDVYNNLGTYDPEKVLNEEGEHDYIADGGMPSDNILVYTGQDADGNWIGEIVLDYYEMDGGKPAVDPVKTVNVNGGWPKDIPKYLDDSYFPETETEIFDPYEVDIDMDALYPFEYEGMVELDGGWPRTIQSTNKNAYDGGYPKWAYVWMIPDKWGRLVLDYTQVDEVDPCAWFKEWNDVFRYPTLDTSNRIDGFNVEANMEELQEAIGKYNHPKFEWCRGYNIREVLPTKYDAPDSTPHYFEYEYFSEFPQPGVVGNLLQETSSGKYYMWAHTGYYQVRRVYEYGVQDFLLPNVTSSGDLYYTDPQQLVKMYERNKKIYEELVEEIDECEDQDEFFVLKYVFEYLFTMRWDLSYYNSTYYDDYNNATYRPADTFHEFVENKNALMYQMYEQIMAETDDEVRMYNIGEFVDKITDAIDLYLETDALQYIYYFLPSKSWNMILAWLSLLIDFFKSYKTYMLEISASVTADDKYIMRAAESDHIAFKKFKYEWSDTTAIDDEYDMEMSVEWEDTDIPDFRIEDRIYFDQTTRGIIDLNGTVPNTAHYTLDLDGSPARIPTDTSTVVDMAESIDGGPPVDYDRTEEYNGGTFVAPDVLGYDLNGGKPYVESFLYNINGGIIPTLMYPGDSDADGSTSFENVVRSIDYDGFEALQLANTIYMHLDGGWSSTTDYYYNVISGSIEDAEASLMDYGMSDLDAGRPATDYGLVDYMDEAWFAEYDLEGGKPDRMTITGEYKPGKWNTETYSRPYEIIDIDLDGGPAEESEYYKEYNTLGLYDNDPIDLIEWDGGPYNGSKLSLHLEELKYHQISVYHLDTDGEKYLTYYEPDAQYIDLDAGGVEDRTSSDPVTEGYADRAIKRFVKAQKNKLVDQMGEKYDSYTAAEEAETIARTYLNTRLRWNKTKFNPKKMQFEVDQPDLVRTR